MSLSKDISTVPETSGTSTAATIAQSQQSDNVAHALAGAGGGLLSMAMTYPLITLSTRAQVESQKAHTNALEAARRIVAREGVRGLYSGLESALFGITVTNFVYYYWYEWTRAWFLKTVAGGPLKTRLTTLESMAAGAIAGSATVMITNPIWVVNSRMTTRKNVASDPAAPGTKSSSPSLSSLATVKAILKEGGPLRLFAGVLPALVLVINPILQYTIFEQLKDLLERRRRARAAPGSVSLLGSLITPTDAFVLGALGKIAATTITYPYITVKSRAHVATGEGSKEGMLSSLRRIIKEEGWSSLYGGKFFFQPGPCPRV